MKVTSFIKIVYPAFLAALVAFTVVSFGEILSINLLTLMFSLTVLGLAGLFASPYKPSLALSTIFVLNPLTIYAVFVGNEFLVLVLSLVVAAIVTFQYGFFSFVINKEETNADRLWHVFVLGLLTVLDLILLLDVFSRLGNMSFEMLLSVSYFDDIWISYWSEPVLLLVIAAIVLVGLVRLLVGYQKKEMFVVRTTIFLVVILLLTLLALPIFGGNLISPQYRIEKPVGWDEYVNYMGINRLGFGSFSLDYLPGFGGEVWRTDTIWLIQNSTSNDNAFFEYEHVLASKLAYLANSKVINIADSNSTELAIYLNELAVNDELTVNLLQSLGVDQVVIIESNNSVSNSIELDSVRSLAMTSESLQEVELAGDTGRIFAFRVEDSVDEVVQANNLNEVLLDWDYALQGDDLTRAARAEIDTVTYEDIEPFLQIQQTGNQILGSIHDGTINNSVDVISEAIDSSRDNYYIVANDQPLGILQPKSKKDFQLTSNHLDSLRVYGRYSYKDLLKLADFAGTYTCGSNTASGKVTGGEFVANFGGDACVVLSNLKVETGASALVEVSISSYVGNGSGELCLFSLDSDSCEAKLRLNNLANGQKLTLEIPKANGTDYQLKLRISLPNNQKSTVRISQLKIAEYELLKNENFADGGKKLESTLVSVQQGELVTENLEYQVQEVDLATFSNCELQFLPELKQQIELTDEGLNVVSDSSYCFSYEIPQTARAIRINNNILGLADANIIDSNLVLTGEGDFTLTQLSFYTW